MWIFPKRAIIKRHGIILMNKYPLVSIIIPAYNSEKYLCETIQSATNQTWPHKEIIVIDDGSTDGTMEIAKKLENQIIKVFHQKNRGASAARNNGINRASGDYIQFLDSDDLLSPDKIERQLSVLYNQIDKVAVCRTIHFFDNNSRLDSYPSLYEEKFIYTTDDPINFMIRLWGGYDFNASMIQPNAWLTPADLIKNTGGWNENLTLDDDGEFFARIILNSKGILKSEGVNYYRKYPSSTKNLSAQKNRTGLKSSLLSALLKKEYLFERSHSEHAKKAIFKQLTELSVQCYINQPELYNIIKQELKKLPKYKYNLVIGGPLLNTLSRIIGWQFAKRIQYWSSKIL